MVKDTRSRTSGSEAKENGSRHRCLVLQASSQLIGSRQVLMYVCIYVFYAMRFYAGSKRLPHAEDEHGATALSTRRQSACADFMPSDVIGIGWTSAFVVLQLGFGL